MKKYYVFLFGIIFIFIFTGCSFLSFNSPISYSEFDVGSSSSETDNIIPHEEDSSSDNNDVSSAESALSANEEKELFLDYWNDTHFGNIVNVPDDGDSFQQYDFWLISSLYLQKKFPDKKEFDSNGNECYPTDYYSNLLHSMFGDSIDYSNYLPKSENGLTQICDAYDYGYLYAELDSDSISLDGQTLYCNAKMIWKEPGYVDDLGVLNYTFAIHPENQYSRYLLLSLNDSSIPK